MLNCRTIFWLAMFSAAAVHAQVPAAELKLTADRTVFVQATVNGVTQSAPFEIPRTEPVTVKHERCQNLRVWNARAAIWQQYSPLKIRSQECSTPNLLVPGSLRVAAGDAEGDLVYVLDQDYGANDLRGTLGRLEGGRIPERGTVYLSYAYAPQRYDSVVLHYSKLELLIGQPSIATPRPPELTDGQQRIANIYTRGAVTQLRPADLYTIHETEYPGPQSSDAAERLAPKTLAKLRSGEPITILAWGDSVTHGGYLPMEQRWQSQFVARLKQRFPKAAITLTTEAWPGHSSNSYLQEPESSEHHYQKKVVEVHADLIISEFVNDGWYDEATFKKNYGRFLSDFRNAGCEWIILTPHYIGDMPESPDDPRPYVRFIRQFSVQNQIAVADGSLRFGRLHLQGLSFSTFMTNSFNHPDERGMALFADALMELFPNQ